LHPRVGELVLLFCAFLARVRIGRLASFAPCPLCGKRVCV
jgi:hypothetical protein